MHFWRNIGFCLLLCISGITYSCSSNENYETIAESPVVFDLSQVPYPKLSDYHFFNGELKNLQPALGVLPYKPASELFSDYALKKRFVWMPKNTKATYVSDHSILNLPTGSVVIKVFYYTNVQPSNTTKIIETRLMIKKESGWIFAQYIWNDNQTDAVLTNQSTTRTIQWKDENNIVQTVEYRTPEADYECNRCHSTINTDHKFPLGIKPQNLNFNYNYNDGIKNQLDKWIEMGYLEDNLPNTIVSIADYKDASQPLNLRVRSYFDANCAHCHVTGGEAGHMNLRFSFNETINPSKMGVNRIAAHYLQGYNNLIIQPGNYGQSILHYRINTENDILYIMPPLGRTKKHVEGVNLVEEWINSL
ncbi:hypothetical protein [Flavobacterium sp.]|uniref:hypothetical protein n=1 Tax=Flavobacterium sp. TaxID=239 RepID=UPI002623C90B|nr:hypothetical protein [Flavobacterium sp.]